MANTSVETISPGVITVTYTDLGLLYDSNISFPGGVKLKAIKFFPSAANDILVVRSRIASGPIIAKMKDTTGGGSADVSFGEGLWCFPYIHLADCTYNTPANVIVMFIIG
jgi:hypothetical protein